MTGSDFLLLLPAVALLGITLFLLVARIFLHSGYAYAVAFRKKIFLVLLPKEAAKGQGEEQQKREAPTHEQIQEKISIAESLFAGIGGLRAERGLKAWLFGREDHVAFEIVASQGLISFYVAVPEKLAGHIEQQVHAQYPEAHIEEVPDYNMFAANGAIAATMLKLRRGQYLPLKTYKHLETDPLDALTNALGKIEKTDGAAIQYIIRSAKKQWRRKGVKIAREMQQGKTFGQAQEKITRNIVFRACAEMFHLLRPKGKDDTSDGQKRHEISPMESEMLKSIEEKASKAGMDVNIRIVTAARDRERARLLLKNIVSAFAQVNTYEYGNGLHASPHNEKKMIRDFIFRNYRPRKRLVLNTEEMATLFHLPLPTSEAPNIKWLLAKKASAPVNIPTDGLILGRNVYRGNETIIRIKREDRRRHMYIIGKSGSGKSVLIANMAKQDIANGEGVCVVDPHGDLVDDILASVPPERADDVIYFNPSDLERPLGLNMLEAKSEDQKDFAVQEMIAIFYKLFPPEMIGPMFEHNMRNVMLTLMADSKNPGTIAEIPRMFSDADFQKSWVEKVKDPIVRAFWEKEMAKTSDFHKSEMLGYLISKVGRFVENEMMRNIIGQQRSGFDFREVMDKKRILLVNLAKGRTGEVNSNLLGLIIVSKLQMAALARAELPEKDRHDFYLYIDEFQNFITDSIATILSEARKYRLDLTVAHQYIGQLVKEGKDSSIRDAVFGNVGTIVSFRIGVDDAPTIAKEFAPVFNEYDVINVDKFSAYVKLLIDNQASKAFNMGTFAPVAGDAERAGMIKELARLKYGRDRRIVESEIMERSQLGAALEDADLMPAESSR